MDCPKCSGCMYQETFFESALSYEGWRCLNCGKIIVKYTREFKDDSYGHFVYHRRVAVLKGTVKDDV